MRMSLFSGLVLFCLAGVLAAGTLPDQADAKRLETFAFDLSSPKMNGRLTGSANGKMAEDYVEKAMRATGLEIHTQEVRFPLYEVMPGASLKIEGKAGEAARALKYLDDYREVDFSGSGDVAGNLVFVGYGLKTATVDSYAGVDVKGKIAVILTGIPEGLTLEDARIDRKLDLAARNGAVGVILLPRGKLGEAVEGKGPEAKVQAVNLKREFDPALFHAKVPAVFLRKAAAEALTGAKTEELEKSPAARELSARVHLVLNSRVIPEAVSRNVIGILRGTDSQLGKETILIGAHYDHLGVGADGRIFCGAADNASGTAVVLEAASAFAKLSDKPKRTVAFALWCGEEQGLYGSTYYVTKAPLVALADTKLMIQLDYLDDQYGPCITNPNDNPLFKQFFGKAAEEGRVIPQDFGGQCASDDCPFLSAKVPAYRFIAQGEHHHRDVDTAENLSVVMLKKTADLVVQGIRNTAY